MCSQSKINSGINLKTSLKTIQSALQEVKIITRVKGREKARRDSFFEHEYFRISYGHFYVSFFGFTAAE